MEILNILEEIKKNFISVKITRNDDFWIIAVFEPYQIFTEKFADPDVALNYIAGFAQKNYYKNMVNKIKKCIKNFNIKHEAKIFCNSTLSEKKIAEDSGLGFYGKNSLIISQEFGVNNLIGGVLLPIEKFFFSDFIAPKKIKNFCGICNSCILACPTGALTAGKIDATKCTQALSYNYTKLTQEQIDNWGDVLYGCSICSSVCPFNKFNREAPNCDVGTIDRNLKLSEILIAGLKSEMEVKALFKKSALSLSWIKGYALVRNAMIISVKKNINFKLIEKYSTHSEEILKDTCLNLLNKNL